MRRQAGDFDFLQRASRIGIAEGCGEIRRRKCQRRVRGDILAEVVDAWGGGGASGKVQVGSRFIGGAGRYPGIIGGVRGHDLHEFEPRVVIISRHKSAGGNSETGGGAVQCTGQAGNGRLDGAASTAFIINAELHVIATGPVAHRIPCNGDGQRRIDILKGVKTGTGELRSTWVLIPSQADCHIVGAVIQSVNLHPIGAIGIGRIQRCLRCVIALMPEFVGAVIFDDCP